MPAISSLLVGPLLQIFFTEYLSQHKHVSHQTIVSYRDTFRLLLQYVRDTYNVEPAKLRISELDAPVILAFLAYLEQARGNKVRSRNQRLAAIRAFFRVVALRDPASVGIATRIMAIPMKRCDKRLVGYLSREEIDAIVSVPDRLTWRGRRDHALLLTMYNSGARVSEIAALAWPQVRFGATTYLEIKGKGRKERVVPLWSSTAQLLRDWQTEQQEQRLVFPSVRGKPLGRDSIRALLVQAAAEAAVTTPSLAGKRVSPHVFRHSTAMHLLQSGVDLAVIALWLGHEDLQTTHGYLEADLAMKEQALEKLVPFESNAQRFKPDDELLAFLKAL